jgi:hypothetical protein
MDVPAPDLWRTKNLISFMSFCNFRFYQSKIIILALSSIILCASDAQALNLFHSLKGSCARLLGLLPAQRRDLSTIEKAIADAQKYSKNWTGATPAFKQLHLAQQFVLKRNYPTVEHQAAALEVLLATISKNGEFWHFFRFKGPEDTIYLRDSIDVKGSILFVGPSAAALVLTRDKEMYRTSVNYHEYVKEGVWDGTTGPMVTQILPKN